MVSEPRSYVQFPPATYFFDVCIPPSLVSVEPAGMAAPEQEHAAPIVVAHTQGVECWTIA
jgi:hypothetical protein